MAVTFTFYGDLQCASILPSPFRGVSNPLVAPLNVCTKSLQVNGILCVQYQEAEFCAGWTDRTLHKTNHLLIHIPASNIHLHGC
jgi:hypothetical protein